VYFSPLDDEQFFAVLFGASSFDGLCDEIAALDIDYLQYELEIIAYLGYRKLLESGVDRRCQFVE
jgi:hypothetical protein